MPESTRNKIESQFLSDNEKKAAVLRVYLIEHPQPAWEHVSDVVYRLRGGEYHSVLERVQSLFPTGENYQNSWSAMESCKSAYTRPF